MAYIYKSNEEEFRDKKAWAALQRVEMDHRGKPLTNYKLIKNFANTQYNILGLPAEDKEQSNIWIIINEKGPLKILPQKKRLLPQCREPVDLSEEIKHEHEAMEIIRILCKVEDT